MKGFQKVLLTMAMTMVTFTTFADMGKNIESIQKTKPDTVDHDRKIVLVNTEKVLNESKAAKSYTQASIKHLQPKLNALSKNRDSINIDEQELKKNSLTLTKTEFEKKEADLNRKKEQLIEDLRKLREEKEMDDQKIYSLLQPKLDQAISNVAKKENYSLVLNSHAVLYYKNHSDITDKIIKEFDGINDKDESQQSKSKADNQPKKTDQYDKNNQSK